MVPSHFYIKLNTTNNNIFILQYLFFHDQSHFDKFHVNTNKDLIPNSEIKMSALANYQHMGT